MSAQDGQQKLFTKFNLDEAWEEVKGEFQNGTLKSKAFSSTKLVGKSIWNLGLDASKTIPKEINRRHEEYKREKAYFEKKSNRELYDIVKGGNGDTRSRISYDILKARKSEYDTNNNQ